MKQNNNILATLGFILVAASSLAAQQGDSDANKPTFEDAARSVEIQLEEGLAELSELRRQIGEEQIPLNRELAELETTLLALGKELQEKTRANDRRAQDLSNLRSSIKTREQEASYLSGLMGDYVPEFAAKLHIAEKDRYEALINDALLAPENKELSQRDVYAAQAGVLEASVERLHELAGGAIFPGRALDGDAIMKEGEFALIGPVAIFRSSDGTTVGTADLKLGSLEATVTSFPDPADDVAAADLVKNRSGSFPLDATLGDARKVAATEETFLDEVDKGGPVMIPIFVMAGIALLIAFYKWLALTLVRQPSRKKVAALFSAVECGERGRAQELAAAMRGPAGKMLDAATQHLGEPRDLIEEVMYERVLTTRLRVQKMLPFIAICAASAPLLGLLGTVSGIINTFKMITIFGSGDVKSLSGGISEALITTKYGLIVAIPSLLLHAFLSRKARGIVGRMEALAVSFVNHLGKSRVSEEGESRRDLANPGTEAPDPDLVRARVNEILRQLLGTDAAKVNAGAVPVVGDDDPAPPQAVIGGRPRAMPAAAGKARS